MPDTGYVYHELLIVNGIYASVIADADAPLILAAFELLAASGRGFDANPNVERCAR